MNMDEGMNSSVICYILSCISKFWFLLSQSSIVYCLYVYFLIYFCIFLLIYLFELYVICRKDALMLVKIFVLYLLGQVFLVWYNSISALDEAPQFDQQWREATRPRNAALGYRRDKHDRRHRTHRPRAIKGI